LVAVFAAVAFAAVAFAAVAFAVVAFAAVVFAVALLAALVATLPTAVLPDNLATPPAADFAAAFTPVFAAGLTAEREDALGLLAARDRGLPLGRSAGPPEAEMPLPRPCPDVRTPAEPFLLTVSWDFATLCLT
jgi:hypothetical protein